MAALKLIVLCDGTWCGSEANTETNIYRLATMIGIPMFRQNPAQAQPIPYEDATRGIRACYFPGAGLGGTFLEYLFNGATGNDIDDDCIRVYRYIVEHYTSRHKIWMFGLSRGAYTVRCVAGMINNCGILTLPNIGLCGQVYNIYRSRGDADSPTGTNAIEIRKRSYSVATPVEFMGLFDTVGALGIPYLYPGYGLTFHQFYDTRISTVVEKVYHALSIHDRLWCFEPCHAFPSSGRIGPQLLNGPQFQIHERWFPGCHYDLGRQRFRFLRNGKTFFERALGFILNPLSKVIEPNHVFADVVLKWMIQSIGLHAPPNTVIPGIPTIINILEANIMTASTGSGDIYNNLLAFGPAGRLWGYLTAIFPVGLIPGFSATIDALTRTRNRTIADPNAVLTLYDQQCPPLGSTVGSLGQIGPAVPWRYPSSTYEDFVAALRISGNPINPASSPC